MRISRIYISQALGPEPLVALDEETSHYLRNVLRVKPGAELAVFDGCGIEFQARVSAVQRDVVTLELGERIAREAESPLTTHLGLGISRGERMDLAIQKSVELGVSEITPLLTEHCVVQLAGERAAQRLRHWQKVAQGACEQCGRNRLPVIHPPEPLAQWVGQREGLRLFLHPYGGLEIRELPDPAGHLSLLSGPEGGFSETERRMALDAGFTPLRLGPRILRSETAALAALAAVQVRWGDLGG